MKTSDNLKEVFDKLRPHINGHKTLIEQFHEAIQEVEEMERKQSNTTNGMTLKIQDISVLIENESDFNKVYDILYRYNQPIDEDANQFSKVNNKMIFLKGSKEWALDSDYLNTRTPITLTQLEEILKNQ